MGRNLKEVEAMQARLTALAAEEGLTYHLDTAIPGILSTLIALCISPLLTGYRMR